VPELADLPRGCPFADRCALAIPRCGEAMPEPVDLGRGHFARCIRIGA
jgi:peptide/nickel transport system ATP-binding protein